MKHPAPYSASVLKAVSMLVEPGWTILDPFAGTGRIHTLADVETFGVEIEPEWAGMHPRTVVADALDLPFATSTFDCVVTSPSYGNRMADHHEAKDASRRITYRHYLGRPLHDNNSGAMQWGSEYREFHEEVWSEVYRVLKVGGRFILNISDHIRNGQRQRVTAWHIQTLLELKFDLRGYKRIRTPRMKFGQNYNARVEYESLVVFEV